MSDDAAGAMAAVLQAVANPNRIRILRGLQAGRSRMELVEELPITESGVSNHLRTLEDAGLVYRADGEWALSPVGVFFAVFLEQHLDVVAEAVARMESAEQEAREEFAEVPLSESELEAAVTRRKWELVREEIEELLEGVENKE